MDNRKFDFSNISHRYRCVICNNILQKATQTPCGCRTCDVCIRNYMSNGSRPCPGNDIDCCDNLTMTDIKQDRAINKEIAVIEVTCPLDLCSHRDIYSKMETHIKQCKYQKINCSKCQKEIWNMSKLFHEQNECEMRFVTCKRCEKKVQFNKFDGNHLNCDILKTCLSCVARILERYPFKFRNLLNRLKCVICRQILKNAKQTPCGCRVCDKCIKNHLINGPRPCPCRKESNSNDLLTANDINVDNATNREIINLTVKCPFVLCSWRDSLKNIQHHIDICEFRDVSCDKCHEKYSWRNEASHNKNKCQMRIVKCGYCNREMKYIHLISHTCPVKMPIRSIHDQQQLNDLVEQTILLTPILLDENNVLLKIPNFRKIFELTTGLSHIIRSKPFYTDQFGYNIYLIFYPSREETHLSVAIAIIKGKHDENLPWPFKLKLTINILDQKCGSKHHSGTFLLDTTLSYYQNPKYGKVVVPVSSNFIQLSQLMSDSPYCLDDVVVIGIKMHPIEDI